MPNLSYSYKLGTADVALTVPGFDPDLGDITAIYFVVELEYHYHLLAENTNETAASVAFGTGVNDVQISILTPLAFALFNDTDAPNPATWTIPVADGSNDFAGTSGSQSTLLANHGPLVSEVTDAGAIAEFVGSSGVPGEVDLDITRVTTVSMTADAGVIAAATVMIAPTRVTMIYEYDEPA